ncbi:alpha/beta hydrolase [Carboxylicivirga sp. N1Y90]|uniref:alpha/beta hydrolase n=1 Tax=Carboxylicivirga fragile TaxID=3417571 RepID=UPI003D33068C|nr:hypothetical protein [Marinilabiliaceae bacterium N1Y90]
MTTLIRKLVFSCALFCCGILSAQDAVRPLKEAQCIDYVSTNLNDSRRIFISAPDDFTEHKYPVAYLIGAQENDFRASILMNEFVVVGIETKDFKKDFLSEESRALYLQFLKEELIPYIEKEYQSTSVRLMAGHSLAAGMVIEALLKDEDLNTFYIATSPTLQLIDTTGLDQWKSTELKALYFNIGLNENYPQLEAANHAFHFKLDSLKPANLQWKFEVMKDETHETNAYTGFCRGYSFYKSLSSVPDSLLGQSIDNIVNYASNLKEKYGLSVAIDETVMMPNILINLGEQNFDEVKMCIEYMANEQSDLFADQIDVVLDVVDAINKSGEKEMALGLYQFIVEKIDDPIAKIMVHELTREE